MKILITGAGGYIGKKLTYDLAKAGHTVVALVRSTHRFNIPAPIKKHIQVLEGDLLTPSSLTKIPKDIEAAYYLVHSMGHDRHNFPHLEKMCAENFIEAVKNCALKQIIYLSGLCSNSAISLHMTSRKQVENILKKGPFPITVLRTSIIIGSGSASFEIIYDLVDNLPMMVAPKWVKSKCQPIAISDVLYYLTKVLSHKECLNKTFEIGGPDVLSYKEVLLGLAAVRKLKRYILVLPLLTPHLSSLWLFLVTSTNLSIAKSLIHSLAADSVVERDTISHILPHKCLSYIRSIEKALDPSSQDTMPSSWKSSIVQSDLSPDLSAYIQAPVKALTKKNIETSSLVTKEEAIKKLWSIGGENGWYHMNLAWKIRGFIDRLLGGVGLRRGRAHQIGRAHV